jgi:hypothetical protein
MKLQIELHSIHELVELLAIIRAEPLDPEAVAALTQRLAESARVLKAAEDAQPHTV